jgi:surface polysaccharide O-acyltransferase-like enzyme
MHTRKPPDDRDGAEAHTWLRRAAQAPGEDRSRPAPGLRTRRADLDALRVFGMLAVFTVHVAQVFSPWQTWHVQNAERSVWGGQINLFAFPWLMPLFMLLAGAGAAYSLSHRDNGSYLGERTVKLVIPFVLGTILLVSPQVWIERLVGGRTDEGFLRFFPHFFECCYPDGNLAAGHLWFVAYLWVYAVVSLPLLRFIESSRGQVWMSRLKRLSGTEIGVLWLGLPIALGQIALRARFPQTLTLVNDWANHAVLFVMYVLGFAFATDGALLAAIERQWTRAIGPAVVSSSWLAWYAGTTSVPGILPLPRTLPYFAFWFAFGVASWSWIVAMVGLARRLLRGPHHRLAYVSRSLYPFYMVHQTAIVVVAWLIVGRPGGMLWKALTIFAVSLVGTTAVTELARRWAPTRVLLGMDSPEPVLDVRISQTSPRSTR